MRSKLFLLPILQILSWYILLNGAIKIPSDDPLLYKALLVLANLLLTLTILYLAVLSHDSDTNYISLAESGYASKRAMIYVMSPIISMVLFVILAFFTQIFITTLCAIIVSLFILLGITSPSS